MNSTAVNITSASPQVDQQQSNDDNFVQSMFKASSHPKILFFHLLFRSLAVVLYLLSSFADRQIVFAILVIVFVAFDFWTVKNVSGRLLVGLRWWNDIKTDGKSSWVFESKPRDLLNKTDSRVFWWSLYVYTIIWVVFLIIAIIKLAFMWSVIDAVAITLSTANLAAYTKCDRDAKQKLKGFLSQQFMQNLLPNPLTSWMGS